MSAMSLRARLLLGAALWTVGLFLAVGVVITQLIYAYPSGPRVFHGPFVHAMPPTIIAIICLVAGFLYVRHGVSPVGRLRARLSAVHAGRERRVDGQYPAEVQPLVDDLNALLDQRERLVTRAQAKAGDLAHGLKTPLAVLASEAARAAAAGHQELAALINQEVNRMRRQVDYHLAHARAAASGAAVGARTIVRESAEGLARTLERLHADRGVTIDVNTPADHAARAEREDTDEMLGNLLDNACKWARAHVTITSTLEGTAIVITVDDDGPGLEVSKREVVLQRGVRADEAAPGSGFGLAIVRELAELYGGSIVLASSPMGGLRARLTLPASHS